MNRFYWAVGLALGLSVSAHAQNVEQSIVETPSVQQSCELHLWPSKGLRSVLQGWTHGGIVDGAVKGRDGYDRIAEDPISTEAQADLAAGAPVAEMLGISNYKLMVHKSALPSGVARSTAGRIEPASSPCYAEIVMDDIFLQQDLVNGSKLKSFIRYRKFDGDTLVQSFGAFTQSDLDKFPAKSAADMEAVRKEVGAAFLNNISKFGMFLQKPKKK